MAKLDFTDTPDDDKYVPVPEGEYLCVVQKVEEKQTKAGDDMWGLWLEIIEGNHKGRLVFDNIVFSDKVKAKQRAKLIFHRMGFDVEKPFDAVPSDLEGKRVKVTVEICEYNGKVRNEVPFSGYAKELDLPDEEIPF